MNRKGEWGQNLPPKFGILGDEEERQRGGAPAVRIKRMRQSEPEPETKETPQSTEGAPGDQTPRKRSRKEPPGVREDTGRPGEHQPKLTSFYFLKSCGRKTELASVRKTEDLRGSTERSGVNTIINEEKPIRLEIGKVIKGTKLAPEDTSQQNPRDPKVTENLPEEDKSRGA